MSRASDTTAPGGPPLVVRTDADDRIGLGHLVRCFAVALRWRRSIGPVHFVCASLPEEWRARIDSAHMSIWPPEALADLASGRAAVLIDGYELDVDDAAQGFGAVAVIDDFGVGAHGAGAGLLIDQSALPDHPVPSTYRLATRLLRGPRYAMLRPQFESLPPRLPVNGRLLLSLGGRPTAGATRWAEKVAERLAGDIDIARLRGVEDVAALMSSCEIAVAAAGATTWELCRIGVPTVFVAVADNQLGVLDTVARADVGIPLGPVESVDPREVATAIVSLRADGERRADISERAAALVDGQGARRVTTAIRSQLLEVRLATDRDKSLYFEWIQEPATRAWAFDRTPISWDTHSAWFDDRLRRTDSVLMIVEHNGEPVGQFRVDVEDGVGLVAVSVASSARGRGIGAALIDAGTEAAFAQVPRLIRIDAKVLDGNAASRRAFEAADYDVEEVGDTDGQRWIRFARWPADTLEDR